MLKQLRFLIIVPTLVVMFFGSTAFGMAPSAHAADRSQPPKLPCGASCSFLYATNSSYYGTLTVSQIQLNIGPGTSGSISEGVTWQNTFSMTLQGGGTMNGGTLSANLGWSVTAGGSDTVTCTANNPNNYNIMLHFEDIYYVYVYDVYLHQPGVNSVYDGSGSANQFQYHGCALY